MRRVATLVGLLALAACASTATPKSVRVVPFAFGTPAFSGGDSIEIEEIVGTRPRLEVGGVYVVSGRARVASHDGARVASHAARGMRGALRATPTGTFPSTSKAQGAMTTRSTSLVAQWTTETAGTRATGCAARRDARA